MTFFTFLRFTKQLSVGNKMCSNSSQSGQKVSKHMYSYIWNSSESILSLAHKAMNCFSMIGNIHRSSQVACVQTSSISLDRDDCFDLKNVIDHVIT